MSRHPWFADEEALDWSLVAAKRNQIVGTAHNDRLAGTEEGDDFQAYQGGSDHLTGLAGDDRFYMGNDLDLSDRIDGGAGVDSVVIENPPRGPFPHLVITDKMFESIEKLVLAGSQPFDIEIEDGLSDLKVKGNTVGALTLDARALSSGSVHVFGGNAADTIVGGGLDDRIIGGIGADVLTGGLGDDQFIVGLFLASSPMIGIDTITDFSSGDSIKFQDIGQPYHIGETPGRAGDVVASYDADSDMTSLYVYGDSDSTADSVVYLMGEHLNFEVRHDVSIVGL